MPRFALMPLLGAIVGCAASPTYDAADEAYYPNDPRRVEEAYAAGYFGERSLGTDFSCDLFIYRGAGSFVCGVASALITSIEGKRGYPRNRPPMPRNHVRLPTFDFVQ